MLVKVIVSEDQAVIDRVIRATNNQTLVEVASLHATDKIQRDIEAVLERHGWYYERRKNYYKNLGHPASRIVAPLFLARAAVALAMKNPPVAERLKSRFMRNDDGYERVFVHSVPLKVWPDIVRISKAVDRALERNRPNPSSYSEHFLAQWRPLLSLLTAARALGTFDYAVDALAQISNEVLDSNVIDELWRLIASEVGAKTDKRVWRSAAFVARCCKRAAETYSLEGVESVGRQTLYIQARRTKRTLTPQQLERINSVLPAQPWPLGVHITVGEQLQCDPRDVSAAIEMLMQSGLRHRQKHGIVYDEDGNVIATDLSRLAADGGEG